MLTRGGSIRVTRVSQITLELINVLGAVHRHHGELMQRGATAPSATLAQPLTMPPSGGAKSFGFATLHKQRGA